jgi:thiol peroxidase
MDIGYASEKVKLFDEKGSAHTIAGQNGKTQLIISTPFINKTFKDELQIIDTLLKDEMNESLECHLVVASESHKDPQLDHMDFLIDKEGEFGDWYGLRLEGDVLEGEFTKSLMLISKDGALFYDEYPMDISSAFNQETLQRKITAAQTCYTGKGCH